MGACNVYRIYCEDIFKFHTFGSLFYFFFEYIYFVKYIFVKTGYRHWVSPVFMDYNNHNC